MANRSIIITSSLTGDAFESIDVDVVSDSDSWQVIDPSDSDGENYSYNDVTTDEDDVTADEDDEVVPDVDDLLQHPYGSPSSDISMQSLADEITRQCQELNVVYEINQNRLMIGAEGVIKGGDDLYNEDENEIEDEEEDDDHDDDDLDLDDELVPKWLSNKFERQRMRKLGKRAYPKMKKSKRLVNQYSKPGCVHGKHGLGLKHNLIW
ncbi:uncharacterized protein [Rutidosis leptorrhynchoides]|uniref:uncharacterized protein n=1 Tax=Rutidosis leptorrhynchoides TaxID=125765 RepID=UPI003A99F6DF